MQNETTLTQADFQVNDHGTVFTFKAVSHDAQFFYRRELKNELEPWQLLGPDTFALDHRPGRELALNLMKCFRVEVL